MEKQSNWMTNPKCCLMLKEKPDGWQSEDRKLKYPVLFKDTIYLLPADIVDKLVADGWAKECHPKPLKEYLDETRNSNESKPEVARGNMEQEANRPVSQ